jgi:hypothetical protein
VSADPSGHVLADAEYHAVVDAVRRWRAFAMKMVDPARLDARRRGVAADAEPDPPAGRELDPETAECVALCFPSAVRPPSAPRESWGRESPASALARAQASLCGASAALASFVCLGSD